MLRERAARLAAWWRRQDTMWHLVTFGREAVAGEPHEPLVDADERVWPRICVIEGLDTGHPRHQRRPRRARHGRGLGPERAGWR